MEIVLPELEKMLIAHIVLIGAESQFPFNQFNVEYLVLLAVQYCKTDCALKFVPALLDKL
jgi:hypothetical protein